MKSNIIKTKFFHKMKYDLKGHMRLLLFLITFRFFNQFIQPYLDLRSYGQLLSLFFFHVAIKYNQPATDTLMAFNIYRRDQNNNNINSG